MAIEALTHELAHIRRIRFGVKSETLSPLQRDVFEETLDTDLAAIEAEVEQLQDDQPGDTVAKPKRPRAGRQPLPDHLPRIEHRHEPESCTCGHCGKDLVKIGEDITEQLDVEPAKFFVRRHLCPAGTSVPNMPAVRATHRDVGSAENAPYGTQWTDATPVDIRYDRSDLPRRRGSGKPGHSKNLPHRTPRFF